MFKLVKMRIYFSKGILSKNQYCCLAIGGFYYIYVAPKCPECSIHIILQSMKRLYSFIVFCSYMLFQFSIIKFNKFDSLIIKTHCTHYLHVAKVYSHIKHHKDFTDYVHGTITKEETKYYTFRDYSYAQCIWHCSLIYFPL